MGVDNRTGTILMRGGWQTVCTRIGLKVHHGQDRICCHYAPASPFTVDMKEEVNPPTHESEQKHIYLTPEGLLRILITRETAIPYLEITRGEHPRVPEVEPAL